MRWLRTSPILKFSLTKIFSSNPNSYWWLEASGWDIFLPPVSRLTFSTT